MTFELNRNQLIDIALALEHKVKEGLRADDQEIKCFPTFIHPDKFREISGETYVLDLGGSNVRAALISIHDGKADFNKKPIEVTMPWKRNKPLEKEKYLSIQSGLLESLGHPGRCPLGYCFSYPAKSTPDGDAILKEWSKEIIVPGVVGQKVGRMLLDHVIHCSKGVKCSKVTVINDTIASLLAGLTMYDVDAYIGLIVGTGTNMATFIDSRYIPKLSSELDWQGLLPVNLESGGFHPPHLTSWDKIVDDESENIGNQRFEKAVSGAYLGRVFKAVFPESDFPPESGAEGIVRLLNESEKKDDERTLVAPQIYHRSAKLVACSLAGLIKLLNGIRPIKTITIVAEGSLFWGKLYGDQHYFNLTNSTLKSLLADLGLSHVDVKIVKIENANLVGSAIAALL